MKKFLLIMCMVLMISCIKAQELVFDPIAFDEMVMQTYYLERDIENQIKEIEYIYQMLEYQITSIKKLNPDSYFAIRNFVIDRNSAIKSLKSRIRNLGVKIGDEDYMLGDVLPADKEISAWFKSLQEAQKAKNTEQYQATLDEINSHDTTIRQYLTETSLHAAALGIEADDLTGRLDYEELLDEIEGNESITSQLQISNKLSVELNLAIAQLVQSVSAMNRMYAANSLSDLFGEYKLNIPNLNPGVGGIITEPSEAYEKYMNDRDSKVFDPIELFNMDRE